MTLGVNALGFVIMYEWLSLWIQRRLDYVFGPIEKLCYCVYKLYNTASVWWREN